MQMKIEDLLLVRLSRISFCHHCPGRREWKDSKTSRACRLLPRESDTGAIAKRRIDCSLAIQASLESVCRRLET